SIAIGYAVVSSAGVNPESSESLFCVGVGCVSLCVIAVILFGSKMNAVRVEEQQNFSFKSLVRSDLFIAILCVCGLIFVCADDGDAVQDAPANRSSFVSAAAGPSKMKGGGGGQQPGEPSVRGS